MMISCPECKKGYSSEAKMCVHCGARNPKRMSGAGKLGVGLLVLVVLFGAFLMIGAMSGGSGSSGTTSDLCSQSADAAHYIAAMSASDADVVAVTDRVIADQKYPLLGDKVVASIGMVVATSRDRMSPDAIADGVRARCQASAAQ